MEKGASISNNADFNQAKEQEDTSESIINPECAAKRRKDNNDDNNDVLQSSAIRDPRYFMLLDEMSRSNKLPLSLESLLQNIWQRDLKSPAELLIAVVYYLFLECGFVPAALSSELKSKVRVHWGYSFVAQIPDYSWKIVADDIYQQYEKLQHSAAASTVGRMEQIYEFKLNLLQHSNDDMRLIIRKIFGGTALCVTFCLSQKEQATSIILPIIEFISVNENTNFDHILRNPNNFIRNVKKLNETVKQNLISPSRNVAMYESAYPNAALHGMPKEILWTLFKHLRTELGTLQKVSQTCVYLRNMAIAFLSESNIKLRHRRPTPIIYDTSSTVGHRSRYRIFHEFGAVASTYYPHIFWNPFQF